MISEKKKLNLHFDGFEIPHWLFFDTATMPTSWECSNFHISTISCCLFFFHTFVFSFSSQGTFLQQTITFQNILQGFAVGLLLRLIICRNNKLNLKESLYATLHKRAKLYLYSNRKYWKCRSKDLLSKETFFFFLFPDSVNTLSLALANMVN